MTISAAAIEIPDGIQQRRRRWMSTGDVAGVANPRHPHLQQLRVVGAVCFVAIGAILSDRWVFPQEWAAPLGVAAQTVFVNSALNQLPWIGRSMRIVATGAGYLTFPIGHVRRTLQLGAAHLVTLETEFRLRLLDACVQRKRSVEAVLLRQRLANLRVPDVAIHAGHSAGIVGTAFPEEAVAA